MSVLDHFLSFNFSRYIISLSLSIDYIHTIVGVCVCVKHIYFRLYCHSNQYVQIDTDYVHTYIVVCRICV